MKSELEIAIQLRKEHRAEEALEILKELLEDSPKNAQILYQLAWTCDFLGLESEAVPYYEKALEHGLAGLDRRGAFLGLGSTYRCLGSYEESLATLARGIQEFPGDQSLKVFHAMTLYNLKDYKKSVQNLLEILTSTTEDSRIQSYKKAIDLYATDLDKTWNELGDETHSSSR